MARPQPVAAISDERPDPGTSVNLVCAILPNARARSVLDALAAAGHRATRVSTTGGLMQRGNTTLLVGVEQKQLDDVLALIRKVGGTKSPADATQGHAIVFVLDVQGFEHA